MYDTRRPTLVCVNRNFLTQFCFLDSPVGDITVVKLLSVFYTDFYKGFCLRPLLWTEIRSKKGCNHSIPIIKILVIFLFTVQGQDRTVVSVHCRIERTTNVSSTDQFYIFCWWTPETLFFFGLFHTTSQFWTSLPSSSPSRVKIKKRTVDMGLPLRVSSSTFPCHLRL